jgi:polyhydroxyalkanoate synthesis regulator protein
LTEVKQLVMDRRSFVVRDAKTNEDLTAASCCRSSWEEAGGAPMFSEAALANLIRVYGHASQTSWHLPREERPGLHRHPGQLTEQSKTLTPEMWAAVHDMQNPRVQGMMGNYVEQSKSVFGQDAGADGQAGEQMLGHLHQEVGASRPVGTIRGMTKSSPRNQNPKVGFVSLGCPKALTDSELILDAS